MLTAEENNLLCLVEGDVAMGQIFRRHWLPACLIEEVPEADGTPIRVSLLGEKLVAFRDSDGRVGLVGEFCPHRGASLALGRNEECGLRCLYHGWKVDVDGNVVEMSSEPAESGFVNKVRHKSYPTSEAAGFVWTYMGPQSEMPEFQPPAFMPTPDTKISIVKIHVPCNWAQILEGAIDSAHSSTLHSTDMVPARVDGAKATDQNWLRPSTDKSPRLEVEETNFGFRYAAIRRPIQNSATHHYVRMTTFIAPYTVVIPPNNLYKIAILHVPSDDTNTAFHFIAFGGATTPDQETWRKFCGGQVGIDVDAQFRKFRTYENNYLQDRNAMKLGSFTGIRGIPNQDIAMWETMGPIVDRSRDRLGASDVAIVEFRRIMVEAARRVQGGEPAIGTTDPRAPHISLQGFEAVVPKTWDWRTSGAGQPETIKAAE
ncbi:MAG: Rieske 2Fe-2S domain-containing protein [Rhodomicrobium sp.]